jgi:hypothetical protein
MTIWPYDSVWPQYQLSARFAQRSGYNYNRCGSLPDLSICLNYLFGGKARCSDNSWLFQQKPFI